MSSYAWGITVYGLLFAALAALIFASHHPGSRVATASHLIARVRAGRAGRVVLVLVWWWVGWHLFVR